MLGTKSCPHKEGPNRVSTRGLMKAAGLTDDEIGQPFVGIACSWTDAFPGHNHLNQLAEDAARGVIDDLKSHDHSIIAVISTRCEGKLNIICGCGKDAVKAGAMAGKIVGAVAKICGGKGGGRPDSAMAGAADESKLDEALASVPKIVEELM